MPFNPSRDPFGPRKSLSASGLRERAQGRDERALGDLDNIVFLTLSQNGCGRLRSGLERHGLCVCVPMVGAI